MSLNIIFMGTPDFAVPILKSLAESNHNILQVYTQPPRKKNRGLKIIPSPIHELSNKISVDVKCPKNLDTVEEVENIKKLKPDVVIVVAYGKILPKKMLNIKNIKFINIHASLLPKWRGAAPIQRSLMNLDKSTGISVMKIVPKLDSGPIMMVKKIDIVEGSNFLDLSKQLSELGAKTILECLDLIEKKQDNFIPQNDLEASYAKKINKVESKINWNKKAKAIIAKINALNPNPGAWFEINDKRIKPIKAKEIQMSGKPGTILKENFTIGCLDKAVQILELQKEGKKPMTSEEYLRGNTLKVGSKIKFDA